jgi:hypothetical protein
MGMTLQEIDDALTAWNGRLTAMADNLMSLQAESTYKVLTGSGGGSKLDINGVTADRTAIPLGAMRVVFEHFDLLHSTVDRAAKVRSGLPTLFGNEEKVAEIDHLLRGKSIELPTASLSLEQRTLLSGAQNGQRLTPDELMSKMAKTFAEARDAVLAVDRAWQEIAERVTRAETQIGEFEARYAATGCGTGSGAAEAFKASREVLNDLGEMFRADPLGALARMNAQLEPVLGRLRALVEASEQAHRATLRARAELERLAGIHSEALTADAEARLKIADCKALPAPVDDGRLNRLRDWLGQLERRWNEGALDTVSAGLRNWQAAAGECAAEDVKARDASRLAVETRRELRGRMEALKAKARAMGVAEQGAISTIATRAESLLAARPTDLAAAGSAVALYAQRLNQIRTSQEGVERR